LLYTCGRIAEACLPVSIHSTAISRTHAHALTTAADKRLFLSFYTNIPTSMTRLFEAIGDSWLQKFNFLKNFLKLP
jgi:hypothetical protein